jgi:hypothetical protein
MRDLWDRTHRLELLEALVAARRDGTGGMVDHSVARLRRQM